MPNVLLVFFIAGIKPAAVDVINISNPIKFERRNVRKIINKIILNTSFL